MQVLESADGLGGDRYWSEARGANCSRSLQQSDLACILRNGKFVASSAAEGYDAHNRGLTRKFRINEVP
jgi:hypothetical protein